MVPTSIPVHETHQNTVQGEGFWAGSAIDRIQLSSCPIDCPLCQVTPRTLRTIEELVAETRSPRVVISGGEPFVHANLSDLVVALMAAGKKVHVETPGTYWRELPYSTWITLSPRHHLSPRFAVQPEFWDRANEIKITISQGDELEIYLPIIQHSGNPYLEPTIYLKPDWQGRDRTVPLALALLQRYPYCKLSLPLQKLIGVR